MKTLTLTTPELGRAHPLLRELHAMEPRSLRTWAKSSGVHFSTICHLLHGKRTPSVRHFVQLAEALGYELRISLIKSKRSRRPVGG
jgi:hypothetical protein